jgi:hypothetical protein
MASVRATRALAAPAPRWPTSLVTFAMSLLLGWFAFVQDRRVPLLSLVDLGVHELGHLLFMAAPDLVTAIMGNGTQTLMPLLAGTYFAVARRDWPGLGVCLAWAGTTMQDASVYIADAPYQALPLLFGDGTIHDWAYVFGPEQLDRPEDAVSFAQLVHGLGVATLAAGAAVCVLPALARQLLRPR